MAYVYMHIRKDNNQPFYIGVGGLLSFDNYQRANSENWKGLSHRSDFWKNVVFKYGFKVEIVLNNCTKEDAFLEEQRLISLYGRKDIKTGILVNHTAGGEGRIHSSDELKKKCGAKNIGKVLTKEHKQKISLGNKGKKLTQEDKAKKSLAAKGKPKNYRNNTSKYVIDTLSGIKYDSCEQAAKFVGIKGPTLRAMLNGRNKNKTNLKYL
jgi:hypothetical protein